MVELSSVEIWLTRPFRVFVSNHLKISEHSHLQLYAFVVSLLACICSGTVVLYSLWTPYFSSHLGYSQIEINIIGGFSSMGMYLLLPLIGNLADIYGTVLLSLTAFFTFVPGYFAAAWFYQSQASYWLMTTCFTAIGLGVSCLYFASLLTCANIYPKIKGLSISLPVTCYGLSSLLASRLIQDVNWFHSIMEDGTVELNIVRIFRFFGVMYSVVCGLSYTSSCILTIQKQINFVIKNSDHSDQDNNSLSSATPQGDEQEGLLNNSMISYNSIEEVVGNDELITEVDSIVEVSHQAKFSNFIHDPSAYLLLIAFFLCVGPLEMYINNMGSLVVLVNKLNFKNPEFANNLLAMASPSSEISIATQVSFYSFSSTATRLFVGACSDYLASVSPKKLVFKNGVCRIWLLILLLLAGVIDQFLIVYLLGQYKDINTASTTLITNNHAAGLYSVISCLSGVSYGGIFTIYPSVMASIWGIDILGSTWGSYMVAPAFSSLLFGIIYANVYDYFHDYKVGVVFIITGISIWISMILTFFTWRFNWYKRGFKVF